MKKTALVLSAILFIITVFSGCSSENKENNSESSGVQAVSELPENKYTKEISEPEGGEIISVSDSSEDGSYFVTYKISEKDKDNYIKDLEKLGYKLMSSDSSVLTMLTRDNVTLNIAYSNDCMSILILIAEE